MCKFLCLLVAFFWLSKIKVSTQYIISVVTPPIHHAEGPHWDVHQKALLFVDTFHPTIYKLKNNKLTHQKINNRKTIGTITPISANRNKYLVTSDETVTFLHWDGRANNTGKIAKNDLINNFEQKQANDGKADKYGNFWIGLLKRNEDLTVTLPHGALYLIDKNGNANLKILNVTISNGIAWNDLGNIFYYVDSATRSVVSYEIDRIKEGDFLKNASLVYDTSEFSPKAMPDGITIDENNDLWIALHGGKCVLHVNSTSGRLIKKIELPVSLINSVAFGGENLDVLYVTTSRLNYDESMLKSEPLAGSVFAIQNLGVKGKPMFDYVFEGNLNDFF